MFHSRPVAASSAKAISGQRCVWIQTHPSPGIYGCFWRQAIQSDGGSEGNVAVPTWAALALLAHGDPKRTDELEPSASGLDDVVDVTPFCGDVWIRESFGVVGDQLGAVGRPGGQLAPVQDVDRALGPHHGDLGRRPRDVEVSTDVLRAHDAVGAAV